MISIQESIGLSGISSFARKALQVDGTALDVLDIPCGFGRHSLWLASLGHRVTGIDISTERIDQARSSAQAQALPHMEFRVDDAERPLPFEPASFDLILVVHYVSNRLLSNVVPLLRPGGLLVYETFGGQGYNWQELPDAGAVASLLRPAFELLHYRERAVGPAKQTVAVKVLARKC